MGTSEARRRLVKILGGGALMAAWKAPVIDSVTLPEHGQASPPPPPPPVCPPAEYGGVSPVDLPNSGSAYELGFVRTFYPGAVFAGKWEPQGERHEWVSDDGWPVVLVKAGRGTYVFTNVYAGEVLKVSKGISHISKFDCVRGV